jgi:hypothetical protein
MLMIWRCAVVTSLRTAGGDSVVRSGWSTLAAVIRAVRARAYTLTTLPPYIQAR